MKGLFLAAAVVLGFVALAAADTLDVLFRNTLLLVDAQGGVTTIPVSEEGKFEQTKPLEADKTVGDSWEIRGPTGHLA